MKYAKKSLIYIVLIAVFIVTVFPVFYAFSASLKNNIEILTKPGELFSENPSFVNYSAALSSEEFQFKYMFANSILYTVVSVVTTILVSALAGFAFARLNFPFKKLAYVCFTLVLFVKLGGISVYATFDVLNFLHLPRNLYTLMLVHLFAVPTANMYLVRSYVHSIPSSVFEAAKIDGCSVFKTFYAIALPLIKPVLATICILTFTNSWNDYIMPNVFTLTQPTQRTLMVGLMALKSTGGAATNWGIMLAGTVVAMLPIFVVYLACNKYFVGGITAGAEKG